MGVKYYVPENHADLAACEGFYIENEVFFGISNPNNEKWEKAIQGLSVKLKRFIPYMHIVNDWRQLLPWKSEVGVCRYVLLEGKNAQIIVGDDDRYMCCFVIIPENVQATKRDMESFDRTVDTVCRYLLNTFGEVYRRKNTWNLEQIKLEKRGVI